jgi:hypothetical protein
MPRKGSVLFAFHSRRCSTDNIANFPSHRVLEKRGATAATRSDLFCCDAGSLAAERLAIHREASSAPRLTDK